MYDVLTGIFILTVSGFAFYGLLSVLPLIMQGL